MPGHSSSTRELVPPRGTVISVLAIRLQPKKSLEKKVWVSGYYYVPTLTLEIDGKKIEKNLIQLDQKAYTFYNPSDRVVILVYIFKPERLLNR